MISLRPLWPRVSAALFEPDGTGRQIQFIMGDQNLLRRYAEISGQAGDRLATAIHEGGGFEQPAFPATLKNPTGLAMESGLIPEYTAMLPGKQINEPEARVMAGFRVLPARITQTYNETDWE